MARQIKFKDIPSGGISTDNEAIDFLLPRAQSFIRLRFLLGVAAAILPLWLLVGGLAHGGLAPTISDFYHSAYRDVFVGNLVTIGVFFWVYQGEGHRVYRKFNERHLAILCGTAALAVAFIPNEDGKEAASQAAFAYMFPTIEVIKYVHMFAALIFFGCLAVFCACVFAKDKDTDRANLFKACAAIIVICVILIAPVASVRSLPGCLATDIDGSEIISEADCNWSLDAPFGVTRMEDFENAWSPIMGLQTRVAEAPPKRVKWLRVKTNYVIPYNILFWLEAIAVWAFALAWFLKAAESSKRHKKLSQKYDPDEPETTV